MKHERQCLECESTDLHPMENPEGRDVWICLDCGAEWERVPLPKEIRVEKPLRIRKRAGAWTVEPTEPIVLSRRTLHLEPFRMRTFPDAIAITDILLGKRVTTDVLMLDLG